MKEVIHIHTLETTQEPATHFCFVLDHIQSVVYQEKDCINQYGSTSVVVYGQTYTFRGIDNYNIYKRIVMALEGKEEDKQ